MALMDKMKAQAAQLAQKAQEAGKAGQSKIEDVQAKRRADGILRDIGAAVYAQRTGTPSGDTAGDIDHLVDELSRLEAEKGPLDPSADGSPQRGSDNETGKPPEGDFTL